MKPIQAPQRVLVKEANWLGDVVMSLPALKAVRRAFPAATFALLVKNDLATFFDGATWVDEVIPYDVSRGLAGIADLRGLLRYIHARRFDLAVLIPRSFSSALWMALARVPRRAGFVADARGPLLTHKAPRPTALDGAHQVHEYLYMLHHTLGVDGNAYDCMPDVDETHLDRMRAWLVERRQRPRGRLIALAAAAAYGPAKEWPADRFAVLIDSLADRHGAECVLVGAPGERGKCERVAAASRRGAIVAAGETNVGEAIALLSLCDGFAGNDSGSVHVAGALGIPTVGVFGSTRPERTGPRGPKTRILYHRIACSPCMKRTCRLGHYDCLSRISVDEVAHALTALGAFG